MRSRGGEFCGELEELGRRRGTVVVRNERAFLLARRPDPKATKKDVAKRRKGQRLVAHLKEPPEISNSEESLSFFLSALSLSV